MSVRSVGSTPAFAWSPTKRKPNFRSSTPSATGRRPDAEETAILIEQFEDQLNTYSRDPGGAQRLLSVGQSPRNDSLNTNELAAWTTVASMILCLDETLNRP